MVRLRDILDSNTNKRVPIISPREENSPKTEATINLEKRNDLTESGVASNDSRVLLSLSPVIPSSK
jgi:hypothetical protein